VHTAIMPSRRGMRRYSMRLTLEDCSSLVHTSDVPSTLSMARRIRMTRHPLNADDTAQIASTPGTNVQRPAHRRVGDAARAGNRPYPPCVATD
jgi:hypothetical protein